MPVVFLWDERSQHYRLTGLLQEPPQIASFAYSTGPLQGTDLSWYREAVELFERPVNLGSGVSGYAVGHLRFGHASASPSGPVIFALYRLTAGNAGESGKFGPATPIVYQRAIWSLFTTDSGSLKAGSCQIAPARLLAQETARGPEVVLKTLSKEVDSLISEGCDTFPG